MIWAAPRSTPVDRWEIRPDPDTVTLSGSTLWEPAIALPVEDKDELVLPAQHRDALSERLRQVSRVLTFGWKAREGEFMKLLALVPRGVPVDVLTVSQAGVAEAAELLRGAGLEGPATTTASGFGDFVNGVGLTGLIDRMTPGKD